jgi:hypothetical protein
MLPALTAVLAAVALAAPPTHAGPLAVIPDAAGGYDRDAAPRSLVIPDAAGGYPDAAPPGPVIADAAGGYDDGQAPAEPGGAKRFAGTDPRGDDGLPWEVVAAGLVAGTLVLTTTGAVAGRRRTFRARTVT